MSVNRQAKKGVSPLRPQIDLQRGHPIGVLHAPRPSLVFVISPWMKATPPRNGRISGVTSPKTFNSTPAVALFAAFREDRPARPASLSTPNGFFDLNPLASRHASEIELGADLVLS